jgi:hypothetical protein
VNVVAAAAADCGDDDDDGGVQQLPDSHNFQDGAVAAAPAAEAPPAKKGFFGGLRDVVNKKVADVRSTAKAMAETSDTNSFVEHFRTVAHSGARLINTYACVAMHDATCCRGKLFVTTHSLCFVGSEAGAAPAWIKEVVPLESVAGWLPSLALPSSAPGGAPFFMGVVNDVVLANALQVFTHTRHVLQFYDFTSSVTPMALLSSLGPAEAMRAGSTAVMELALRDVAAAWSYRKAVDGDVPLAAPHFA